MRRSAGLEAVVAVGCLAAGVGLALHYPLGAAPATAAFLACTVAAARWPGLAWSVLPSAVVLIGGAPWTGWITFEELDLLVLAVAAGGYLRLASRATSAAPAAGAPVSPLAWLLASAFAASLALSCARGLADAGGFAFGWFQGYLEPMNSLRLAKSFFLAWLLVPLWREAERADPRRASARLAAGLAVGLAAASLGALWERRAFTGLLDFSADYRTTSLFWEMHVGGAAFDGFLALTVPFALRALQSARTPLRSGLAVAVLLVASYACLTTFSRGVFMAIPAGAVVTLWLMARQAPRDAASARRLAGQRRALLALAVAFAGAAVWMFPTSGYRGMLALLGVCALLLRLGGGPRPGDDGGPAPSVRPVRWIAAFGMGAAVSAIVVLAADALPKGAYLADAAALALGRSSRCGRARARSAWARRAARSRASAWWRRIGAATSRCSTACR